MFVLISEIQEIERFESARQLACFAGLSPTTRMSGTSVRGKPKISKVGSSKLRGCLYFPAISAADCHPLVMELSQRLKKKTGKVVITACMRKLLHIVYGVWKSGKNFSTNP